MKLNSDICGYIRSNLYQNEQAIQLSRRLNESEKNLQRARAEVVRLKNKMDELAVAGVVATTGEAGVESTDRRVVENLKSVMDAELKERNAMSCLQQPLKERVVCQTGTDHIDPPLALKPASPVVSAAHPSDLVTQEAAQEANQENDPTPVPITKSSAGLTKRQVRMNSDVRVLYDDGDSTLEMLCLDDKGTAGAKKVTKPQAKQVPVVDASQAPAIMECNQQ